MIENGIVLVDQSERRRAQISSFLYSQRYHVEAFESLVEYRQTPIHPAVYLIYDDDPTLEEAMDEIAKRGIDSPLIAYSEEPQLKRVVKAISNGATDYLEFPFGVTTLEALQLHAIPASGSRLSRIRRRVACAKERLGLLTVREHEVLSGIASGHSNKEIARQLSISHRTVEIHRSNLMIKLGVTSSAEVVRLAVESDFAALFTPETRREAA